MEKFCTYHKSNHSKKNYLQWINSMTIVINQLLDQHFLSDKIAQEIDIEENTKKGDTYGEATMFLWDWETFFDNDVV